jgi:prepilin-type N-terminal cleavage/methylation domain-containing protein
MPTFRPNSKTAGFTLIEMLVVLTLVAVLAGVAMGVMGGRRPSSSQQDVIRLRDMLTRKRSEARRTGVSTAVGIADLRGVVEEARTAEGRQTIIFFPDGSSSGGTIVLRDRPALAIDWLTGAPHAPQ